MHTKINFILYVVTAPKRKRNEYRNVKLYNILEQGFI